MSAGKRILAIAAKGSVTEGVMRDLHGNVVDHGDVDGIADSIGGAIDAFTSGLTGYFPDSADPPVEYEARHNADRLAALLKSVAEER